ncbi:CocE/NonD family hydrolase C-terminal non-catalytic domain-containing protein [Ornithinimicrobium sp. Y1694]|uniref:CocE/NonD family hydrolase C-terminal non-catalytic domain-containing protein n=1 Tax=Ornithinimicrobium sp. Y1694 TaxID=3418590 RepID=UPI003CF29F1E
MESWDDWASLSEEDNLEVEQEGWFRSRVASGSSAWHHSFDTGPLEEDLVIEGVPEVTLRVRQSGEPHGITLALVARGQGSYTDPGESGIGHDVERAEPVCWGGQSQHDTGCYPGDGLARVDGDLDLIALGSHGIGRDSTAVAYQDPGDGWVEITVELMRVDTVIPAGHELSLVVLVDDPLRGGSGQGSSLEVGQGTLELPGS